MFSTVRKVLAIGKTLATGHIARDIDTDASLVPSPTRQRTRTRTTSLKGMTTCSQQSLQVEVTVKTSPHALTAVALIQHKDPAAVPVFVATHSAIEDDELASNSSFSETSGLFTDRGNASGRVNEATAEHSRGCAVVDTQEHWQVWCDENDAHEEILQNLGAPENTALMKQSIESADLLAALYNEPGAVVWESAVPDVPHIVFTPADEAWDDFAGRCSNQPNQQWVGPYLHVPLAISPFSPFGPTDPPRKFALPVTVFSRSRFAASVSLSLNHTPSQALFAQKRAYKAVAYVACLAGSSLRAYYDNPTILQILDNLYVFAWTDPAAPLLEVWRTCFMISVYESDHPFAGVPHIVVTDTLPNAPWDIETAMLPEQDERFLSVPMCAYTEMIEEEDTDDDKWYCGDDEEEVSSYTAHWSESEEESEYARTPSPPSWPLRAYPTSTGRSASTLDDVFEEDEDAGEVPSVLETRFRRSWLQDDDDEDVPPPVISSRSSRFKFSATLPDIGERTPEDAYRPLAADYKSLWTGTPMLPDSDGAKADESGDDQSQYMDALDHVQDSETESQYVDAEEHEGTDVDQSEDDYGYHAHHIPRPSCDIFLNDEDEDPTDGPQFIPRGKANIPAGKADWFDLLDDSDLGSLDWPTPSADDGT